MDKTIADTLSWLYDIGVTQGSLESPVNRYDQAKTSKKVIVTPVDFSIPNVPKMPLISQKQAVISASHQAQEAQTLDELRKALESFEGCDLKHTAMHTVFGDGNPEADIMLIGEAPGADEDRLGKPFVGLSGQLLDKIFASIGLDRTKIYITNILPWRPPGNRQPTNSETEACLPFVKRHIELVNPKLLVMVGGVSTKTILGNTNGITRMRGKEISYTSEGLKNPIQAMAIYHPAYLLRSPSRKQETWYDMLRIRDMVKEN